MLDIGRLEHERFINIHTSALAGTLCAVAFGAHIAND